MAKTKQNIWDEIKRMQQDIDLLFGNIDNLFASDVVALAPKPMLAGPGLLARAKIRKPLTDIWENDKEIVIKVELPGVNKDDIEVNIIGNGVEVKVENKFEKEEKKKTSYRFERTYSGFYRFFSMPSSAEFNKIKAKYSNGILELNIPKKKHAKLKSKKITVK